MRARKLWFLIMLAAIAVITALGNFKALREASVRTPTSFHHGDRFGARSAGVPAAFVPVQSTNISDLGAGRLLVASRNVGDPNFAKSVVLLIHYDDKQVEGLILNRRTTAPLSMLLKGLNLPNDVSGQVYIGGPVEPHSMFSLFQVSSRQEGAENVFGNVYLIRSTTLFDKTISTRPDPNVFHVYLGCAEWTPDQLEKEVTLGAWFIFPGSADAVFTADPDSLWSRMVEKAESKVARIESDSSLVADSPDRNLFLIGARPASVR